MIEQRWEPYDLHSGSDLEQEFFNIFSDLTAEHPEGWQSRYSYGSLSALKLLNSILSDNGMIYIADIPSPLLTKKQNQHYMLFGNSKANYINEDLMINYMQSLGYSFLQKREANLSRIVFCKNDSATTNKKFREFFLNVRDLQRFVEIVSMFQTIKDSSLSDVAKILLDKLLEIDNQSSLALTFQGSYHLLNKNYEKALDFYKQARDIDFSSAWDLDYKISGTEMFI
jgi:tetratricopeptide (TPR) repeat protein